MILVYIPQFKVECVCALRSEHGKPLPGKIRKGFREKVTFEIGFVIWVGSELVEMKERAYSKQKEWSEKLKIDLHVSGYLSRLRPL